MPSKIIIISAPSGAGKSTLIARLLQRTDFRLGFSVSATSRQPRGQEQHEQEYYFLSLEEFQQKIENQEFIEYEEVYSGCYYGTLYSEIQRIESAGNNPIFDVDVVGGAKLKQIFGSRALSIFIAPPSVEILRTRLERRGTDTKEMIARRVAKAKQEFAFAPKFDRIIINDDLQHAEKELVEAVKQFLSTKRVTLYFGSFNPIHKGHLGLTNYLIENDLTDEVWFVVSPHNPLKNPADLIDEQQRIAMVKQAIGKNDKLQVSDIEFNMPKPSYTVDTIDKLKENFSDINFSLLIGSDNALVFGRWKDFEKILKTVKILVYPRKGFDFQQVAALFPQMHYLADAPQYEISSTQIRAELGTGKSNLAQQWLPTEVLYCIKNQDFRFDNPEN